MGVGRVKTLPFSLPRGPVFSAGSVNYGESLTHTIPSENGEFSVSERCRFLGTKMEGMRRREPLGLVADLVNQPRQIGKRRDFPVARVVFRRRRRLDFPGESMGNVNAPGPDLDNRVDV